MRDAEQQARDADTDTDRQAWLDLAAAVFEEGAVFKLCADDRFVGSEREVGRACTGDCKSGSDRQRLATRSAAGESVAQAASK